MGSMATPLGLASHTPYALTTRGHICLLKGLPNLAEIMLYPGRLGHAGFEFFKGVVIGICPKRCCSRGDNCCSGSFPHNNQWSLATKTEKMPQLPPLDCLTPQVPHRPPRCFSEGCQMIPEELNAVIEVGDTPSPGSSQGSTMEMEPSPSPTMEPPVPPVSPSEPVEVATSAAMPDPSEAGSAWKDMAAADGRPFTSSSGHWSLVHHPKASPVLRHKGSPMQRQLWYDGNMA